MIMKIFQKQGFHFLSAVFLAGLIFLASGPETKTGSLWGISTLIWLILALLFPVLHQFYVVICWRSELYYGWLSRTLGEKAFFVYGGGFMILFLARPLTVLALGIANQGSFPIPLWLNILLLLSCGAIVVYMGFSFVRYFGVKRALGEDHFDPQRYRELPFVRQGIFKWSSNAMYTYAFLLLWGIGLAYQSQAALLAAAFNHIFIWAHFFFTEKPDMQVIYGNISLNGN
jgi:hypothetical protein